MQNTPEETKVVQDLRLQFFTPAASRMSRAFKGYTVRLVATGPGQPLNYVISLDNSGG